MTRLRVEMNQAAAAEGWMTRPWMPDSRPGSWGMQLRHPDRPGQVWRIWHDGHDLDDETIYIENRRKRDQLAVTTSADGVLDWITLMENGIRPCEYCGRHSQAFQCLLRPAPPAPTTPTNDDEHFVDPWAHPLGDKEPF